MKYKIIFDPLAKKDLQDIFIFVAINDSVDNARKLIDKLENTCNNLEELPFRGHIPKELFNSGSKKYLEIIIKPYRILYKIVDNIVYIQAVFDSRRNVQDFLIERIIRIENLY